MANDKNIKIYTAADIEKYHKALLSAKEMHALEKASLDDPFLADALEGYAIVGVNVNAEMAELKNRLVKRTQEENKLVPVDKSNTSSFYGWKVAAMFLLIAGAGIIVYQVGFNNKSKNIAETLQKGTANSAAKDSDNINSFTLIDSGKNSNYIMPGQEYEFIEKENSKKYLDTIATGSVNKRNTNPKGTIDETERKDVVSTVTNAPAAKQDEIQKETLNDNISQNKINAPGTENDNSKDFKADAEATAPGVKLKRNIAAQGLPAASNDKYRQGYALKQPNIFRGRVTDVNNNALPFSNITNIEDNIGTYSDAKGYFNLVSPDSVLIVKISSIGFKTNNVKLHDTVANNMVFLEEDRSGLAEVVISNKKVNSNRTKNTMVLEEPEPADGWSNYDIYLANNLKVPESTKHKQIVTGGEVELSFDVSKEGEPVNITVKKSLCETCDKEAIRLVKEGPKWKRKTKKGKASVTVSF